MKFCWFRLYVSEKELNLVFETLPYRINSTDFFIFRQGKKMESNPWQVDSIDIFYWLKCPECMFFSQEELDFKDHAMGNHPRSYTLFGNFEDDEYQGNLLRDIDNCFRNHHTHP